ncbi:hypothetical protein Tco_1366689, partial [Tanacetum coccineum]
ADLLGAQAAEALLKKEE